MEQKKRKNKSSNIVKNRIKFINRQLIIFPNNKQLQVELRTLKNLLS